MDHEAVVVAVNDSDSITVADLVLDAVEVAVPEMLKEPLAVSDIV